MPPGAAHVRAAELAAQHEREVGARALDQQASVVLVAVGARAVAAQLARQCQQPVDTGRRITFDTQVNRKDRSRVGERTASGT